MKGFESQMNIGFPERPPEIPKNPETELENKKAAALRAICRIFPRENAEELHTVTPEGVPSMGDTLIFRRPPDPDRYIEETFFRVTFDDKSEAAEVQELTPKAQSYSDVLKKGRKAI